MVNKILPPEYRFLLFLAAVVLVVVGGLFLFSMFQLDYEPNRDIVVIKLNMTGNLEWVRQITDGFDATASSLIETPEGRYALGGQITHERIGISHPRVIILSSSGEILRDKQLEDTRGEVTSLVSIHTGGYVAWTNYGKFLKLDQNADVEWNKTFPGMVSRSMLETKEGVIVAAGSSQINEKSYPSVTGLNGQGTVLWQNISREIGRGEVRWILEDEDEGGYFIGASGKLGGIFVSCINQTGNFIWMISFNDASRNSPIFRATPDGYSLIFWEEKKDQANQRTLNEPFEIILDKNKNIIEKRSIMDRRLGYPTIDGGYILADQPSLKWILKMGINETESWATDLNSINYRKIQSVTSTSDGGYIILAY